jgi:glycosyltransferase involved in cell wall biosynthesis
LNPSDAPLVSVVTPFYNSAEYLAACVESVLAQTLTRFEYILVDNCSTDQSSAIAERFAASDNRIRLIKAGTFRGQVENYNYALAQIDARSRYCKLVQADDWIYPRCLEAMIGVAERQSGIGIVGAYSLRGKSLRGAGLPVDKWHVSGRDAARMQMLEHVFLTGSPTTIMYRADLVRARQPFYDLNRYHEDTEVAYAIFQHNDLGFVHELLSYQRLDDDSTMGKRSGYEPHLLDNLIVLKRFGSFFLSSDELQSARATLEYTLIRFLGWSFLRGRDSNFWNYQKKGFEVAGLTFPRWRIFLSIIDQVLDWLLNPKSTIQAVWARLRS